MKKIRNRKISKQSRPNLIKISIKRVKIHPDGTIEYIEGELIIKD